MAPSDIAVFEVNGARRAALVAAVPAGMRVVFEGPCVTGPGAAAATIAVVGDAGEGAVRSIELLASMSSGPAAIIAAPVEGDVGALLAAGATDVAMGDPALTGARLEVAAARLAWASANVHLSDSASPAFALFEAAPAAVVMLALPSRQIVAVNSRFTEATGIERDEAIGRRPAELGLWDAAEGDRLMAQAHPDGHLPEIEGCYRHRDGSLRHMVMTARVVRLGRRTYAMFIVRDHTRQKLSEAAVRDSEQRFRSLVESIGAVVWEADPATFDFTFVSPQAEKLLGYPAPEWLRPGFWAAHVHADDAERVAAQRRAAIAPREDHSLDYRLLHRDGSWRWVRDVVTVIPPEADDDDARPIVCGVFFDVTAEREAAAVHARLAAIVESSDQAIVGRDAQGRVVSWNPGAERLFGYTAEEAMGSDVSLILPHRVKKQVGDEVLKVLEGGRVVRSGVLRRRKDGSELLVDVRAFPVRDAKGTVIGIGAILRDVTAEREAEAERALLAAVVSSSEDAVIARDLQGRIVSWNAAAERLYGWTAQEAAAQPPDFLDLPDSQVANGIEKALGDSSLSPRSYRRRRKDGSIVDVELSVFPVRGPDGEWIGGAGISRDITARRRAEAELARLAAIVDSSNEAIVGRDIDGTIISWNRGAERVYGYSAEEAIGKGPGFLAIPGEGALYERRVINVIQSGVPSNRQVLRQRKDGAIIEAELAAFAVRAPDGTIIGGASIVRDITEQNRTREEAARMAAIVNSSPDAITARTIDGRLIAWNPGAARMFGYSAEEALGRGPDLLMPEGNVEAARQYDEVIGRVGDGLSSEAIRALRRAKDGTLIDIEATVSPLRDEHGAVTGFATIMRDIREQIRAEAEIARLAALVESCDDAIVCRDLDGRIVSWNRGAESHYGWSRDEVLGRMPDFIEPPEVRGQIESLRDANLHGEASSNLETRRLTKDGRVIDVSVSFFPVRDATGATIAIGGIGREITEQKRAQEALRHREEEFKALSENSPDLICRFDRDARVLYANRALARSLGREPAWFVGSTPSRIGLCSAAWTAAILRVAATAQEVTLDCTADTVAGRRQFDVRFVPELGRDGAVASVLAIARDVTERYQAEQARREAEEFRSAMVASSPVLLMTTDREGLITRVEGGRIDEAGRTLNQRHVGRSAFRYYRSVPAAVEALRGAIDGERTAAEFELAGRWWDCRFSPLRDRDGENLGSILVATDVTGRKREEAARRSAEERLRTIVDGAPVILWAIDRDGVCTVCEGRAVDERGIHAEDWVGHSVFELVGEGKWTEFIRRVLGGEELLGTFPLWEELWFEVRGVPVRDASGAVTGAIGVSIDVTERRRAEQGMLQAQKLESLGVLAGGIAHDFNNLLVGILGNAGLALSELSPASPARPTLEAIERAGLRAADLARQMLAYSGRGRFVVQPLDLNAVVTEMMHLLRASTSKNVELRTDLEPGLPTVEGDATQLRQVIMNLVVNASDAIGTAPGVVTVKSGMRHASPQYLTEALPHGEALEGDYVFIEVMDTGCGMDAATLGRIFDPFFTTKFTGRGLGLAAVLGIVRGHGGAIHIESEPGNGSTFTLLLPATAAQSANIVAELPAREWQPAGTVLIVDDEDTVRAVTARAVQAFGFQTLQAADGEAGLQAFREAKDEIACVLLDMTMPRMNGEETFQAIRAIDPRARVVLMSGFAEQDVEDRFPGGGLAGFIQKPYELAALRELLRRVTSGSTFAA